MRAPSLLASHLLVVIAIILWGACIDFHSTFAFECLRPPFTPAAMRRAPADTDTACSPLVKMRQAAQIHR